MQTQNDFMYNSLNLKASEIHRLSDQSLIYI